MQTYPARRNPQQQENLHPPHTLQFTKVTALHRKDKLPLKRVLSHQPNALTPAHQQLNFNPIHLNFTGTSSSKQYVKVGKDGILNFQKNKKNRNKVETHVFLPSIPENAKQHNYPLQSLSSSNLDRLLLKIQRTLHTRTSSQSSFDTENNYEEQSTSFTLLPFETIAEPLKISDFQLGQCIGSGKFGDVHICRHKQTHLLFALKKILKSTITDYNMLTQFTNELKIQYRLDHPNIIKLYTHFDDQYHVFLLMEYAPTGTLMNRINNTEQYTSEVMHQMLQAVSYTHQHRIIHRDIKPENIVLFFNDTFKLCDFGLAASLRLNNDIRTSFCGTLDYIAPEMKDLGLYSFSVDIWGLGVLCYEVLFGQAPFKEEITNWKKRGGKRFSNWNWKINYPAYTSSKALEFMNSLLKQNPNERMSILSALHSEFISSRTPAQSILSPSELALLTLGL